MKILLPLIIAFLSLPTSIYAQNSVYSPLVDLSNAGQGSQVQTFEEYINFLYGFSIALAALLAVIKIVIAGAKYMLSDVISNKGEALKDIQGAILGLLLILSAVIILELINPELIKREIKFNEFQSGRPALPVVNGNLNNAATTSASGAPLRAVLIDSGMDCLGGGGWCPKAKHVTWSGNIFKYNLEAHCTEYLTEPGNMGKEACIVGIKKALTIYEDPTPDVYYFCYKNGAKQHLTPVTNGILSCQLPTKILADSFFRSKFEAQQAACTTDQIANGTCGGNYNSEKDFKRMCGLEQYNGQSGALVQVLHQWTYDAKNWRCAWYN